MLPLQAVALQNVPSDSTMEDISKANKKVCALAIHTWAWLYFSSSSVAHSTHVGNAYMYPCGWDHSQMANFTKYLNDQLKHKHGLVPSDFNVWTT